MNIGGDHEFCPLCQSGLSSDNVQSAIDNVWPDPLALKKQSILYRIQLFILITLGIVCFSLDFFFDLKVEAHWSLIVVIWILAFEFFLKKLMRRRVLLPRILTMVIVMISLLMLVTGRFFGFFYISAGIVVPILCSIAACLNFIFCMIDKSQNAMVYTLCNILVAACIYLILYILPIKPPMAWSVCIMITLICLAGVFVFKGKAMLIEIQKRLFM